jgi:hypothetical protein
VGVELETYVHRWCVMVEVEVQVERNGLNFQIGEVEQGHMMMSNFELT